MKIRNLLAVVAMLSIFIIGIGTAHAVLGVNDDVPQTDIALPLICEKNGAMDTLFAIADKQEAVFSGHYADSDIVVRAAVSIYDYKSRFLNDTVWEWTVNDVVTGTCSDLMINVVGEGLAAQTEVVLNGNTYYVIYAIVAQLGPGDVPFHPGDPIITLPTNRFIAWQYLVDLSLGFASGFNAPGAEGPTGSGMGIGEYFGETQDANPIAISSFYPRYFFLNNQPETWNWWIYFFGRNELAIENAVFGNVHRVLSGIICDEQENCISLTVPIPYELNVINVLPLVPVSIKTENNFPINPNGLGGFASLTIVEAGSTTTFPLYFIDITGTHNAGIFPPVDYYSGHAWSYQREQSNNNLPNLSWDVIHPQHRTFCTVSDPNAGGDCFGDILAP